MSDSKYVKDFYREKGVVPFHFARNPSTLLLQAAAISSRKAEFEFLNAAFDEDYFKDIKCDTQDLDNLLLKARTDTIPDVDDVFSANESTIVGANVAVPTLPGLKGGGEIKRAKEESSRLLFNDLKTVSLQQYHGLIPFFEKYLYSFCFNNPVLSLECNKAPSIFGGHQIDLVIAFVVRYLEGKQYEKSSRVSELTTRIKSSGQIAGVEGNLDSEQEFNKELKREGALGATYLLMHVVSEAFGKTDIEIRDRMFVPPPGGGKGRLRTFFRNARFKNLRKIVGGCSPSRAYLMESEPTENHPTLEAHGRAVLKSEAATSLGCGGWEDGLAFMDTVVEVHQENCLGEDDSIVDGSFTSSRHLVIRDSVTRLSKMYSKFKQCEEVTVAGSRVLSLSPAFLVDTSDLLPILYLNSAEDEFEVPGRVVREFKGATILYPIHGYEGNKNWVSVDDDDDDPWEVRESVVRIPRSQIDERDRFRGKGFFQLDEREDHCYKEGKIAMARHQLARKSDPRDDGQRPFRDVPVASDSKPSAPTVASMPSFTSSRGSPTRGPKRKRL